MRAQRLPRGLAWWWPALLLLLAGPLQAGPVTTPQEWRKARARFEEDFASQRPQKRLEAVQELGEADYLAAVELLILLIQKPDPRIRTLRREMEKADEAYQRAWKAYDSAARSTGYKTVPVTVHNELVAAEQEVQKATRNLFAASQVPQAAEEALACTTVADGIAEITRSATDSRAWAVRAACTRALGSIGGEAAFATLPVAVGDESPRVRLAAASGLTRLGGLSGASLLIGLLDDSSWQVRAAAVKGLREVRQKGAVKPLIDRLALEQGRLRGDIDEALRDLTGEDFHGDHQQWLSWWEVKGIEWVKTPYPPPPEPEPEETADAGEKEQPPGEEPTGKEPTGKEPAGEEPTKEEPAGEEPTKEEPAGEEPTKEEPAGEEPTKEEPAGEEPAGEEPTKEEPAGEEPTKEEPAGEEPTKEEPEEGAPPRDIVDLLDDEQEEEDDPDRTVSFYGIRTRSKRILFIIDISGSMREKAGAPKRRARATPGRGLPEPELPPDPTRLDVAKYELQRAILALEEDAQFNVIFYSSNHQLMRTRGMITATEQNKARAMARVVALSAETSTNVYDTLEYAIQLAGQSEKEDRKGELPLDGVDTFFFLTDGMPTAGKVTDPDQIIAHVDAWNASLQLVIHTIGVGMSSHRGGERRRAREFLEELARRNGGQCVLQD